MKKVLRLFICLLSLFTFICSYVSAADPEPWNQGGETPAECPNWCCGIKLNTDFPIIWNCIETKKDGEKNPTNVFPYMIRALTKVVMSIIMVVCFILIIYAGIMRASSWDKQTRADKAKQIIMKVAITIFLLWFSSVILKLVNPNFFY